MKLRLVLLLQLLAVPWATAAGDQLITAPCEYELSELATHLSVILVNQNQLLFSLHYTPPPNHWSVKRSQAVMTDVVAGRSAPLRVAPGRWAFCFHAPDEIWFYDGLGKYAAFKIRFSGDRSGILLMPITRLDGVSDFAPSLLKEWIRRNARMTSR